MPQTISPITYGAGVQRKVHITQLPEADKAVTMPRSMIAFLRMFRMRCVKETRDLNETSGLSCPPAPQFLLVLSACPSSDTFEILARAFFFFSTVPSTGDF